MRFNSKRVIGLLAACTATSALPVLATLPPFVGDELGSAIMVVFSAVCHQIADRSPHLDGVQLAVCHRCYGIYAALALGGSAFLMLRRWREVLQRRAAYLVALSILVPGVDWFGDLVGLWVNTPASRFITGAVFGLTAGYLLIRAVVEWPGRPASSPHPPVATAAEGSK